MAVVPRHSRRPPALVLPRPVIRQLRRGRPQPTLPGDRDVDARRAIPSVERLLSSSELQPLLQRERRARLTALLREIQDEMRANGPSASDPAWYARELEQRLTEANRPSLRPVINATGVVLHTNLGRAPLSEAALKAISEVA